MGIDEGRAGASAMREYQRRREARERRARDRLGALGVALARLSDDPSSTKAWRKGAEGEMKVARRLEKLLEGTGLQLLHDRRAPGRSFANIDHVAIGPGGVTVIDTKNLRGEVRTERVGGLFSPRRTLLKVGGRDCTGLVEAVHDQAASVRALLLRSGFDGVDVRGALCFANVDGLPLLRRIQVDGVLIDGPRAIAKLARRAGPPDYARVLRISETLTREMPSA